jgi:GTP-binding protein EngB required for normal cell division
MVSPFVTEQAIETLLDQLTMIAGQIGEPAIAGEARSLRTKVVKRRFYLACVGQFKRGKSTLLDALIGEAVLPIGVLPVTSVPTVVCHGPVQEARVRIGSGEWEPIEINDLEKYVSESENPENDKNVSAVEVMVPSALLADGMCFVDTPGIGSVFEENTAATQRFVPQIDAAIVVLGADPPISGEELSLVEQISRAVQDTIFVLNKSDRVSAGDRLAARQFAQRLLSARLRRPVEIFEVSAKEQLAGAGHDRDWSRLLASLERLSARSGHKLAERARQRGMARVTHQLRDAISDQRDALMRPIAESERRAADLGRHIDHAEQSLLDLGLLLMAEQQRLTRTLGARRSDFLAAGGTEAGAKLSAATDERITWGPAYRRQIMASAQQIARQIITPWLSDEREFAAKEYQKVRERFLALAREFILNVSRSGVPDVAHYESTLLAPVETSERSSFHFHEISRVARPASPFRHVADAILGTAGARRLILREAQTFLAHLLEVNSSRVQADIEDQLARERTRLDAILRSTLEDIRAAAAQTLGRIREIKSSGDAAVLAEVERLENLGEDLSRLFPGQVGGNDPPGAGDIG